VHRRSTLNERQYDQKWRKQLRIKERQLLIAADQTAKAERRYISTMARRRGRRRRGREIQSGHGPD